MFARIALKSFILFNCYSFTQIKNPDEKLINIGSYSINILKTGTGTPTIVLDVGFGDTFRNWQHIIDILSTKYSIIAFDRPGYGNSMIGKFPRNANITTEELNTILSMEKTPQSFILLGHSLGALNLQIFADKYPEKTGGILLLDPPPTDWILGNRFPNLLSMAHQETESINNAAKSMENSADENLQTQYNFLITLGSEHESLFSESAKQAHLITTFNNIPLTVIGSETPNPIFGDSAQAYQKYWNDQCELLSLKSTSGQYKLAENSTHQIHLDRPELVFKEITLLIGTIK